MSTASQLTSHQELTPEHHSGASAESVPRIRRDLIPLLINGVNEPDKGGAYSWNVVESLEVLFDAGQLAIARSLARSIQELLLHDSRARLFVAYEALAGIVIEGDLTNNLSTIERVHHEIYTQGHSDADRMRISLVRARALGLGVAMKGLPESELMSARSLIEQQYLHAISRKRRDVALITGVELIKVYLYAPKPEVIAADGILRQLEAESLSCEAHPDLLCDIARFRYHINVARGADTDPIVAANELRRELRPFGALASALGELTIARVAGARLDRDALEQTLEIFEQSRHSAALCEATLLLAGQSATKHHYARAQRFFTRALESSQEGGSCYVTLLSLFGLFQSAWAGGGFGESKIVLRQVAALLRNQLCLSAFGLNAVAAYQLTRQYEEGERLATRCLRAIKQGTAISGIRDQALQLLASCLAARGQWQSAAKVYGEAADSAVRQRSIALGCERRLEMIQASVMHVAQTLKSLPTAECQALLGRLLEVEQQLSLVGALEEVLLLRARLEQVRSQVVLAARDFVTGVKHLGSARELYVKTGQMREVAVVDGCLGVALLEVGRAQGGAVLDEASGALQRSLEFFDVLGCSQVAWKLRFFLASGAAIRAGVESDQARRLMWQELSLSWLDGALADHQAAVEAQAQAEMAVWDNEFAPHLTYDDLQGLQRALRPQKRKKSGSQPAKKAGYVRASRPRFRGQLH